MKIAYKILVGKPEMKRPPGKTGVDGKILLKLFFKKTARVGVN
jgi:hypothetical protein